MAPARRWGRRPAYATAPGDPAARGGWWAAEATGWLARVVRLLATILALTIIAGILLVVLNANPANSLVSGVHDVARSLVGPFDGVFRIHNAKIAVAVNWGLAAAAYLIVGALIARVIELIGRPAVRRGDVVEP